MSSLTEYKFENIYDFTAIVEAYINRHWSLWNYSTEQFEDASCKFQKTTLFHLYFINILFNHFNRDFKKNEDYYEEEDVMESWYELFDAYNIYVPIYRPRKNYSVYKWFLNRKKDFLLLFGYLAEESFYIIFNNRNLLLRFNYLMKQIITDNIDTFNDQNRSTKGTIKRVNIPSWVKKAVFHRDKGRCVYCNTDLTMIFNTLTNKNYDHMVPLDLYGSNDPCNIQLSCEKCNKTKSNTQHSTSKNYLTWW